MRVARWSMWHIKHDACLIAGELIANAVAAAPGEEIRIRCTREPEAILLGVWDASDEMPVVLPVKEMTLDDVEGDPLALEPGHDDGTGGWGLPIVEALAAECGVDPTEPRGKWVWARIAC
ncbi:ATP-binding protein [Spirillospora sp. NPDC029432]|uniref:ATP-binding protein n=1 Tax=Spirillospora sp. NPDC029432 TaxID=3154599 RepID=UPI0034538D2C